MNMRIKILTMLVCLFAIASSPSRSGQAIEASGFEAISTIARQVNAQGGTMGISVRDAIDGAILYEYGGSTKLHPASTMKLVTASAALQVLSPKYRFSTEIWTNGKQEGNLIEGDVYIRGKGDPTLSEQSLNRLAMQLKDRGIAKISGRLVADDSWYDDVRYSIDLPWSDQQEYYGAAISALTLSPTSDYDAGTVLVQVEPSKKEGQAARVSLIPNTHYVTIHNQTKTGKEDSSNTVEMKREHGANSITITGNIPLDSARMERGIAVWEPTEYVLDLFQIALQKQGIEIAGEPKTGRTPAHATLLALEQSIPLSELIIPFMKLSNNTIAEILVKEMGKAKGKEGSWEEGLRIMKEQLPDIGILGQNYSIRDGSGISHANLLSANELTSLLHTVQKESWFSVFKDSLPVAGASDRLVGGTLRDRMKGTDAEGRVKAKTGTLSTVSSLSGYVTSKSGKQLVFSVLLHGAMSKDDLKNIEDQLSIILVNL